MYHYAGNNPVRYVDPDGNSLILGLLKTFIGSFETYIGIVGISVFGSATTILIADNVTLIGILNDPLAVLCALGTVASLYITYSGAKLAVEGINETASEICDAVQSFTRGIQTSSACFSPQPPDDDDDDNDYYESNSKHHQNAKGNISKEPKNAKEMFDKSVRDPNRPNTRWYRDKNGDFHRFQGSNRKYHWNGSTKTGTRLENVPIELRRNLPMGEL